MDIYRAIRELEQEKKRLDGVISSLEELIATGGAGEGKLPKAAKVAKKGKEKRGRKEMTPEERLVVSERMRKYWEARRAKPDV